MIYMSEQRSNVTQNNHIDIYMMMKIEYDSRSKRIEIEEKWEMKIKTLHGGRATTENNEME